MSARALDQLGPGERALYDAARDASLRAYAPWSNLKVGAALHTQLGNLFTGCNVENDSYGLTICAERSAVFAAVAVEGPAMQIVELAVFAAAHTASPCGACRQVIAQFGPSSRVLFPSAGGVEVAEFGDLLPFPFKLTS